MRERRERKREKKREKEREKRERGKEREVSVYRGRFIYRNFVICTRPFILPALKLYPHLLRIFSRNFTSIY